MIPVGANHCPFHMRIDMMKSNNHELVNCLLTPWNNGIS